MQADAKKVLERIKQAELVQFADVALDSPDARSPLSGETPLHIVAKWGEVEAAIALLDAGAMIDVPGEEGCTPLHEAICQGHFPMVELLVSRGASLSMVSRRGDALRLASVCENKQVEEFIRQKRSAEPGAASGAGMPYR